MLNFIHTIKEKWKICVENCVHYHVNDKGHCADYHETQVAQQIL